MLWFGLENCTSEPFLLTGQGFSRTVVHNRTYCCCTQDTFKLFQVLGSLSPLKTKKYAHRVYGITKTTKRLRRSSVFLAQFSSFKTAKLSKFGALLTISRGKYFLTKHLQFYVKNDTLIAKLILIKV